MNHRPHPTMLRQTCANTSDQLCVLTLAKSHSLHASDERRKLRREHARHHASAIVALPCFDQTVAFRWSGDPRDREDPMKAIVQERYGSADVLELKDIDQPELGGDEVLVRVLAASAHIGDWHFMTGLPYLFRIAGSGLRAPKVRVRGTDVAGRVEAVGKDVTQFQSGDEVFGICDGAFAEYTTART